MLIEVPLFNLLNFQFKNWIDEELILKKNYETVNLTKLASRVSIHITNKFWIKSHRFVYSLLTLNMCDVVTRVKEVKLIFFSSILVHKCNYQKGPSIINAT